jgi:hypothetical protein
VHDELRTDLTETELQLHTAHGALTKSVQSSSQRFTNLKTELSKQLEGVNNHLGDLQEDLTQVTTTVEILVANQTGTNQEMSFARWADEHVNEQGKMFQAFDNKLETQAQLLEELQMKIIVSNEEVWAQIVSRKKVKRDGRSRWPLSTSRDGSQVPSSDNDSSSPAAPVPFDPRQQAAPMAGQHSPLQTR